MKILIITQSSVSGVNYEIANNCKNIILEEIQSIIEELDIKIINCNSVILSDIESSDKIIMIIPEWNGSFPFTFKQLIDNSGYPSIFKMKDIFLIGTSDTSFGNIVGVTHFQHILNWIGSNVFDKKVYIPNIKNNGYENQKQRLIDCLLKYII